MIWVLFIFLLANVSAYTTQVCVCLKGFKPVAGTTLSCCYGIGDHSTSFYEQSPVCVLVSQTSNNNFEKCCTYLNMLMSCAPLD